MKCKLITLVFLAGLPWSAGTHAEGQTAPKLTLAQALHTVHHSEGEIVLVVSAESVTLPKEAVPPTPDSSLDQCAAAFGDITASYGSVTALAPATMTLLNNQPSEPDLTQDIYAFNALPQLAASMDDSQWKLLTSPTGISLTDLTTDRQKLLFWAMFPGHTLKAAPKPADGTKADPKSATDFTDSLPSVHLRLGQTALLFPPRANGDGTIFTSISPDPPSMTRWGIVHETQPPRLAIYGTLVRAVVPNMLKTTDLDLDQLPLQTPIPLAGIRTVGELVARIGQTSQLELYTDRHYESKPLTLLGSSPTASPPKLLRALMLCLTATFRRVGPAYMLTDSEIGNAITRKLWSNYEDHAQALGNKPLEEARASLFKNRSAYSLPTFGNPIASTLEQETPDPATAMGNFLPQVPENEKSVPFAKLTAAQQSAARRVFQQYQETNAEEIAQDSSAAAKLNGNWGVKTDMRLEALVPSLPQPIEINRFGLQFLFSPPDSILTPLTKQMDAWDAAQKAKQNSGKPIPTLAMLLKKLPRRAVLAAPHSAEEVASLIGTMKTLGLNQLWLYVFTDGKARIPSTPFSADKTEDLLKAALDAAMGTGITVCPVADLLTWGQSPPATVRDVDVLGENSIEIDTRKRHDLPGEYIGVDKPPAGMSVSPFVPEVQADLTRLIQKVAAYPGIGGLVWRETAPDGYDTFRGAFYDPASGAFGNTLPARLAFLRRSHTDPLDIPEDSSSRMDFHLPNWDDDAVSTAVQSEWNTFRADTDLQFLQALSGTVRSKTPIGVLVEQPHDIPVWFGTWDKTTLPPPQDRSQSHTALVTLPVTLDDDALTLAAEMQGTLKGSAWDGVVLDIAERDGGAGIAGLRALAQEINRPPLPAPK